MLCAYLVGTEMPGIGANLLMAALTHDMSEHKVGDMPAPVKRELPDYDDVPFREVWGAMEERLLAEQGFDWAHTLSENETRVLKLADAADGCLYCIRERAMGNKLIVEVWDNFWSYFAELADVAKTIEAELHSYIVEGWANACA